MKVVYASTPEQEDHIEELIDYTYSTIFPRFFSDEDILKLEDMKVLYVKEQDNEYNGTLKEAFQVISSLQALIAVLETIQNEEVQDSHRELFDKNVRILDDYGIAFPFTMDQFIHPKDEILSKYSKPMNQFLV